MPAAASVNSSSGNAMSVQAAPPLEKPRKPPSAALYEVVVPLLATGVAFLAWEAIC